MPRERRQPPIDYCLALSKQDLDLPNSLTAPNTANTAR